MKNLFKNKKLVIALSIVLFVIIVLVVSMLMIKHSLKKLITASGSQSAVVTVTETTTEETTTEIAIETTTEATTQPTTTAAPTTTKAAQTKPATTKAPTTKAPVQNEARTDASGGNLAEADVPGQNCPYPLCVWTTYTTNTGKTIEGYFVAQTSTIADQRNVYIQNMLPRLESDPSLQPVSYMVGKYEDTGSVSFCGLEK